MDIANLKKIVNDGKQKFKAYEEADQALKELEALAQAEKDMQASVTALTKEAVALKAGNDKFKSDQSALLDQAKDTLAKAQAVADKTVLDAKSEGDRILAKANAELAKVEEMIAGLKEEEASYRGAAVKAKADLDKIEKALASARAQAAAIAGV